MRVNTLNQRTQQSVSFRGYSKVAGALAMLGISALAAFADTVTVMGGEDWEMWIDALAGAGVLAPGALTVAYSYVGPDLTWAIYRNGTIGRAKEDLEAANSQKAAMDKATVPLVTATERAVGQNGGSRAVSAFPELKDGQPVATVTRIAPLEKRLTFMQHDRSLAGQQLAGKFSRKLCQ